MTATPYNAAIDLLDRNLAPGRADRFYLITETRSWSYQEVIATSRAVGCGLRNLVSHQGDRVALMMHDRPEFVIAFWGALRAGLVPVLVPPTMAPAELLRVLADAGARVVVFDGPSASVVSAAIAASMAPITGVAIGAPPGEAYRAWAEVCAEVDTLADITTTEDDPAFLICSSGTTGIPKLVTHLHGSLRQSPEGLGKQVVGLTADDVVLSVSKMCFSYGLGNSLYTPAAVGATTVLVDAPAIPAIVQTRMAAARITVLYAVPSFLRAFLADPRAAVPTSLRMLLSAGERLDPSLSRAVEDRLGCPVLDGYGMTETLQHVTCNHPDEIVVGSCGRVLEGFEIDVRDPDGNTVAEGESGELWIAGRTLFDRYWGSEELTRLTRPGRWMRTGDAVRLRDGHLFHEGRLGDLVKLGGRWFSPVEIEEVLRGHPDLHDVAVASRSDPTALDRVCAFIVTDRKDEEFQRELAALCAERLSTYKIPREWILADALPRTPTGKLRRALLTQRSTDTK
jgi:acyl-coenzyme A synthetase/AMP-(fatty) acid ligase